MAHDHDKVGEGLLHVFSQNNEGNDNGLIGCVSNK